ncbi:MAG: hypothetical protein EXS36_05805 [Pedosphaera sp.]|nr:hypothetical protein [Pedosphaera sp.]
MTVVSPTLYRRIGGRDGIQRLIRPFYMDVRQHEILRPIFNARIQNWPAHLEKIREFWIRQTGGPSQYRGGFAGVHLLWTKNLCGISVIKFQETAEALSSLYIP